MNNKLLEGAADSALGSGGVSPHQSTVHYDNETETRRKNIEDNPGVKAESIEEYRSKNGGSGILKGLVAGTLFAAGTVASLAILFGTAYILPIALAGLAIGALVGSFARNTQNDKIRKGYSSYLDVIAAQGREKTGHDKSLSTEPDTTTKDKSYVAALDASRRQVNTLNSQTYSR